jgi:hypothetical protein
MSLADLARLIGQTVNIRVEQFTVPVTVSDAKVAYGNVRYLVTPVGGSGTVWVDASRIVE